MAWRNLPPAAGNVEIDFEVRNRSNQACWVYGFVGFQTLDANRRPLPQELSWTTVSFFGKSDPPSKVLLTVGTPPLGTEPSSGHAYFNIATDDVLCDTAQVPVASLEIWPPDEGESLFLPAQDPQGLPFLFCKGLDLNPMQIRPFPSLGGP